MQKFLFKISTIIILSLTPNILIGIIRSSLKDPIPFVLNFNNHFLNRNEQDGRINMAEKSAPGVNDMNKQKEFMPGKEFVIRVYDKFGFSNVHQNRSPEIIFIGDSFLDDKFESSLNGIQSLTNKRFNKNISYNIGKEGCAGFKVYNELLANYFEKKPRLILNIEPIIEDYNIMSEAGSLMIELHNRREYFSGFPSWLSSKAQSNKLRILQSGKVRVGTEISEPYSFYIWEPTY